MSLWLALPNAVLGSRGGYNPHLISDGTQGGHQTSLGKQQAKSLTVRRSPSFGGLLCELKSLVQGLGLKCWVLVAGPVLPHGSSVIPRVLTARGGRCAGEQGFVLLGLLP